jgi:hypothetical protein
MPKRYRTSGLRLFALVLIATVVSALWALEKAGSIEVFIGVEAFFIAMALTAWSFTAVHFEGDNIVRTIFFVFTTKRPISSIRRVRFATDEDTFGGRTAYTTVEFTDGRRFLLFDFSKADLREIVKYVSSISPLAIDETLSTHLHSARKRTRVALRRGDSLLFGVGAFLVLVVVLLWLFERL